MSSQQYGSWMMRFSTGDGPDKSTLSNNTLRAMSLSPHELYGQSQAIRLSSDDHAGTLTDASGFAQAGARLGILLMATLGGMALGGWMSGFIFDLTGSYHIAFLNGLAWNLLNGCIVLWLVLRRRSRPLARMPADAVA